MAIHANSTTAPARPLLPLRGPDGRFARRAESTASAACDVSALASESAPGSTGLLAAEPAGPEEVRATVAQIPEPRCGDISTPWEPDTASAARALHARRALAAAVDHGVALFAALGLPQLVGPGHIAIDPEAAGAALDDAIAALDEADGDPEAEPWLAGDYNSVLDPTGDREADGDDEPTLGWSGASQARLTASEDGFDPLDRGEEVNEDGDDLDRGEHDTADMEPSIGWPEDAEAVLTDALQADHDPEADDADDEPEVPAEFSWVFGPSRRGVAHV